MGATAKEISHGQDFKAYSIGMVAASVCSSLSIEETTSRLNTEHPTGINSQWRLSKDNFLGGESNPCICPDYPTTHKHYLFEC